MNRGKIAVGLLFTFVVLGLVGYFSLRYLVTKSFPEYDGTMTIAALQGPVTIYRTEYGVPHIIAGNEHDLFFMQGYVHAQDRLWQMDIARRAGEGRLSEVLGTATLRFDRMLRTVGFKRLAERLASQIDPKSREILQAYTDGVNEFIRTHAGRYPVEFDMLNYVPEPWTPLHSLMISRLMAWELNISWHTDVVLGELAARLGDEKARQVYPAYPENAPVIASHSASESDLRPLRSFAQLHAAFKEFFGTAGTHIGSNSWAIAPDRTVNGHAILANDPHLGLGQPAKWYEVHLKGGAVNVAGYSLPGAPLVILGHTPVTAWGFTNVMADDADFYLERVDSVSNETYLFKGEWKPIETEYDTIRVKDSSDVPFVIRRTHHGPAVNDLYPLSSFASSPLITMRWTGYEMSDELLAIYLVNTARDWPGFLEGVRRFTVPGQNFVYADAAGNIGFQPGVRLPKRTAPNPTLPFPGWTGEHEWTGFVPFEELPSLYNPPQGFIATANNKTAVTPYHISNLWEPPSRIQRIEEKLRAKEKLDVNDCRALQNDHFSHFAKEMTPHIIAALEGIPSRDAATERVLNYFRNWHFVESKEDVPTAIFEVFFNALNRAIYRDEMGEELYRQYIYLANVPYRVTASLMTQPDSPWFDDTATDAVERRDDIVRRSMKEAVEELTARFGPEMKEWRWGRLHTLTLKHPFGDVGVLAPIVNIGPFETGGSGTTVNNGEYRFTAPYEMALGPSMRHIVDFTDVNRALSVLPSGQSGQPLHDHYADQAPLWRNAEYHTVTMDERELAAHARSILTLTPAVP
ncbi:MAG: penicillin acylase family protein [Bacteroidetes bacterium]|nr:MAG: penicillin acylase family protein [Bacteroidota bacterium]